ncbi:MAG TPA: hypothetical protein VGQ28_10105 [Thermoanaerobaculia bacterium]|jgi:hypothetical protein|nr:hypothetical protein [Thermoanaerobaculia bacterium]
MSFKAREILIGVLPARAFRRGTPGFALCGEVTRNEEDDEIDCGEVTRPPGPPTSDRLEDLAVLRQQLRQSMSAGPA